METPEGKGIARRTWDAYASTVNRVAEPAVEVLAQKVAPPVAIDLIGFWAVWHIEGGFEGMRRLGMSRSSIYRRISLFRRVMGVHPDEYELPGVSIDHAAYVAAGGAPDYRQSQN
jgi:hypothetical protein